MFFCNLLSKCWFIFLLEIALVYTVHIHVYSIWLPWWLFTFTSVYTSDHHQTFNFNLLPYSWSPLPISPFFLFLFPLITTTLFSIPACTLCLIWFVHLLGFSLRLFFIFHTRVNSQIFDFLSLTYFQVLIWNLQIYTIHVEHQAEMLLEVVKH